jgi:hypothetical protein
MTNENKYEKIFALKLFASHTTRIIISIQLQIKYICFLIKLDFQIFPPTLMNMQCLKEGHVGGPEGVNILDFNTNWSTLSSGIAHHILERKLIYGR